MRRIKFRGHNGIEWLYDSQISIIPYGKNVHCFMPNEKNKSDQNNICNWDSVSYVGQYTEIKDINGTEIYEGDIVSSWSKGVQGKGVVKQRVDGLWIIYPAFSKGEIWGLCPNQEGISTVEVIGNMYENQELLEGK